MRMKHTILTDRQTDRQTDKHKPYVKAYQAPEVMLCHF